MAVFLLALWPQLPALKLCSAPCTRAAGGTSRRGGATTTKGRGETVPAALFVRAGGYRPSAPQRPRYAWASDFTTPNPRGPIMIELYCAAAALSLMILLF